MTTQLREQHRAVLAATPPFSLSKSLRALGSFAPCAGDQAVAGGHVRKALAHPRHPDGCVVVDVGPSPEGGCGVTLIAYAESPLDDDETTAVEGWVRRWLGLDDDLTPFLTTAGADPPMAPVLRATAGLHQVRFGSLVEGAVYFTLTQRSTQWFAAARKRRIAAELGARGEVDGEVYVAFPALARLAALGADDLVTFGGNRQRAARLAEVLAGVAGLDEEWLRTGPYDEVRRALLGVRGVGAFTAHAILLRVLGRPDDVPLEMDQFVRVAAAVYGDPPPSGAELRARYGSQIGWWAYLSRMGLSWVAADQAGAASESSQRNSVRTPQPVAPLVNSPSAESDQAGEDMSRWAQRSRSAPANSRRNSAAITEPPPISVEFTRSATSLSRAST
jgi:DNA-3-methyladenine glycosylase II